MTPAQCSELVKRLLGAFPTQRMKMSTQDIAYMTITYTAGLMDLSFEIGVAAVDQAIKTAEWIPTIAKIRSEATEIAVGDQRSGAEAWGDVLRAISRKGVYGDPTFADPLVAKAVESIGWRAICMASETDPSTRARFAEAYTRLASAERKETQLALGSALHQPRKPALQGGRPTAAPLASRATSVREGQPRSIGQLALATLPANLETDHDCEGDPDR